MATQLANIPPRIILMPCKPRAMAYADPPAKAVTPPKATRVKPPGLHNVDEGVGEREDADGGGVGVGEGEGGDMRHAQGLGCVVVGWFDCFFLFFWQGVAIATRWVFTTLSRCFPLRGGGDDRNVVVETGVWQGRAGSCRAG